MIIGHPSLDRPPVIIAYCGCNRSATSPIFNASSAMLTFDEFDMGCKMALLANELILPEWMCAAAPIPFTPLLPFVKWNALAFVDVLPYAGGSIGLLMPLLPPPPPLLCKIFCWYTVWIDVVLDTDDWCWKMCWCERCKLLFFVWMAVSGVGSISSAPCGKKENIILVISWLVHFFRGTHNLF